MKLRRGAGGSAGAGGATAPSTGDAQDVHLLHTREHILRGPLLEDRSDVGELALEDGHARVRCMDNPYGETGGAAVTEGEGRGGSRR